MPTVSSTAGEDQADGTPHPQAPPAAATGKPFASRLCCRLQQRADQHQIGGACGQQRDGQNGMKSFAGCFIGRLHGRETSDDSSPRVSAVISAQIQDSLTPHWPYPKAPASASTTAREPALVHRKLRPGKCVEVLSGST